MLSRSVKILLGVVVLMAVVVLTAFAVGGVDPRMFGGRMSPVAYDAYRTAADASGTITDACDVRWQILAGIAEQYAPEEIQGRNVVIVANLAPRKMRGLESQGMVLMAEDREGRFVPLSPDAEPGSIVK